MIAISTIIGVLPNRVGEILAFGGPATVLLSFAVVGVVAVAVMEGISEMVITWPIPNPLVEFVRRFVDRDFAVVICVAYWYTWAITFAALISTAGAIAKYWNEGKAAETLVYALCPLLVFFINFNTVKASDGFNINCSFHKLTSRQLFGYIELFGGILKLLIYFMIFVLMLCLRSGAGWIPKPDSMEYITNGFQYRCQVADRKPISTLIGINLAIYPFLGVESVTMTAFEAKNTAELKMPARNISFIVLSVYMVSIVSMLLNVSWTDPLLMIYYGQWTFGDSPTHCPANSPRAENGMRDDVTHLVPVIALDRHDIPYLGGVINACLLYSAFSAANSALFVASRTLYGLGSSIQRDEKSPILRWLSTLANVDSNGVPQRAIFGSMIFGWIPFLSLVDEKGTDKMQDILQSIGTTSCIIVWASQALAFLRYHWWLRKHHTYLKNDYIQFDRWSRTGHMSWLEAAQPWLAWFALVASLTILLVFASAGLWSSNHEARKQLTVKALDQYLGPGLLLVMFIGLKIVKRRWWVRLGDWNQLRDTLRDMDDLVVPNVEEEGVIRQRTSLERHSGSDAMRLSDMESGEHTSR
ncbi:Amino acid/polyamine transporter I [Macrophomina phaseolina MS6]|uniref:Amino acid/polyamine transporter I n=1 Tax=Macrophomina phaseolina (strain MS6) TaxID=1126212 RepID=K2SGV3_MACPH|nr:Amino acid/polyamine transporter I [Macrophomina phaseolina MS6]